jgi:hypothetical protein
MTDAGRLKVLVLYGGDAATNPRHELLAWLRGPAHGFDVRVVADDAPHSEGAVDDRVDEMIDWADVAIALVTPDARCQHGAPNVIDEIGRWRGARGKSTLCIVRQRGVEPYSNHAGIVYVPFDARVLEAYEGIRRFLGAAPPAKLPSKPARPAGAEQVIEDSGDVVLLEGLAVSPASVVERSDAVLIEVPDLSSEHEAAARRIVGGQQPIVLAFGNTGTLAKCERPEVERRGAKATMRITAQPVKNPRVSPMELSLQHTDGKTYAPGDLARMRAERILLGDPPKQSPSPRHDILEMMVAGDGALGPVQKSPVPEVLGQLPPGRADRWQIVRLLMIQRLCLSSCVEHVDLLRLVVRDHHLVHVTFRGTRARRYAGEAPEVLEVEGAPRY